MPRRRGAPPRSRIARGDRVRRLAEEVLYLHSLWRRGPPAPPPASAPARSKTTKHKRIRLDRAAAAAAEPQDSGSDWALAPFPPNSSLKTWPEAAPASAPSPAKPPPLPASPGALAQQEALRAAVKFFSNRGSSSSSDEDSESEGERDEAGFITGLFERDAALRGHYERGWADGHFACLACAGGTRKPGRKFRGCVALVQHARAASSRYGRPRAHRALAAVVCRVLGWDIGRLPSIVMDPWGTLGQELTAKAKADAQLAKEDVETWMEDSSSDGDEEGNELESSEESAEKEDVEKGTEDSKNTDDDEEAIEIEKSAEKEEMEEIGPSIHKEIYKNEVLHNESVQEVNASKDDSLNQCNNGEVHKQVIAKESSEQENTNDTYLLGSKDTCKNEEHCKEAAVQEE